MKERAFALALLAATVTAGFGREVNSAGIESIETIVVIYAENRSFDNLYGSFPGANGLADAPRPEFTQLRPRRRRAQGVAAGLGRADRARASRRR